MDTYLNPIAAVGFFANIFLGAVLGHYVQKNRIPVFISRKIIHIVFYLLPLLVVAFLPKRYLSDYGFSLGIFAMLKLILLIEPIRRRSVILVKTFTALDRPEDRPYTWHLLSIQKCMQVWIVNIGLYFDSGFMSPKIFYIIAYLSLALGDGLAEPVGRIVKSPRYKVFSLFVRGGNYRTVAGSLCVYIVVFLLILILYPSTYNDFYFQLAIIPPLVMIIEGVSPATLDAPFVFFGTFLGLHLIEKIYIIATI